MRAVVLRRLFSIMRPVCLEWGLMSSDVASRMRVVIASQRLMS